jgi:hypothetical protein
MALQVPFGFTQSETQLNSKLDSHLLVPLRCLWVVRFYPISRAAFAVMRVNGPFVRDRPFQNGESGEIRADHALFMASNSPPSEFRFHLELN